MKSCLFILISVAVTLTSCNLSAVKDDMEEYAISTKERIVLDIVLDYLHNNSSETPSREKNIDKRLKIKETCTHTGVTIHAAGIKRNNIYIETKDFYDVNEKLLNSYRIISLHENSKIDSSITRIEENGYTRYYSVPFEKIVTHKTVREYELDSGYCNSIDYFFEDKFLWKDSVIYTSSGLPLKLYQSEDTSDTQLVYQCVYDKFERLVGINSLTKSGCKCEIKYKKNKITIQLISSAGKKLKYSLCYDKEDRIVKFIQPNEKIEYLRFDEYGNWIECKSTHKKARWWFSVEENTYREILYQED